jgi:hypothetical protein
MSGEEIGLGGFETFGSIDHAPEHGMGGGTQTVQGARNLPLALQFAAHKEESQERVDGRSDTPRGACFRCSISTLPKPWLINVGDERAL